MAKQQQPEPAVLLELDDTTASPVGSFSCESGYLLWGQMHTVIAGSTSADLDTESGPPDGSSFRYRVAARRGVWKVEAAFLADCHIGFVCHHSGDIGAGEVLRRAAEAGLSGTGRFGDLDVVFVNRYDWSGSIRPGCELVVRAVEDREVDPEEEFADEQYYRSLVHGRFMLVDAIAFPSLLRALKEGERIENRNYVMMRGNGSNREAFGTHLVVADYQYDMAWMAFRNGELVGFVYDGSYSLLEGSDLRIGKNLVTAA
jgi:hypothetical protein